MKKHKSLGGMFAEKFASPMDKAIGKLPLGSVEGANWKEKARINSGIGFGLPTTASFD